MKDPFSGSHALCHAGNAFFFAQIQPAKATTAPATLHAVNQHRSTERSSRSGGLSLSSLIFPVAKKVGELR